MRVLVTGATGFLGRHLVPALLEAGHEVRAFHRPTSDLSPFDHLPVEFVEGDVLLTRSLDAAVNGVDAVAHLVGIVRERGSTFEEVNIRGVLHVREASRRAGVRRVVHLGALGTSERHRTRYSRTKAAGEKLWRDSDREYAILRPYVVVGPGGEFTERILALVRRYRRVPVIGNGRNHFQPIWVGDVSRGILAALEAPPRRTWDLVGPDRPTWDEFVLRLAAAMGLAREVRHVPGGVARLIASVGGVFRRDPTITRDELFFLQREVTGRREQFEALTGTRATPMEEWVGQLLR